MGCPGFDRDSPPASVWRQLPGPGDREDSWASRATKAKVGSRNARGKYEISVRLTLTRVGSASFAHASVSHTATPQAVVSLLLHKRTGVQRWRAEGRGQMESEAPAVKPARPTPPPPPAPLNATWFSVIL